MIRFDIALFDRLIENHEAGVACLIAQRVAGIGCVLYLFLVKEPLPLLIDHQVRLLHDELDIVGVRPG